ncbi:MAG: family 16 glycosylhydrolase [Lewinella sp.]
MRQLHFSTLLLVALISCACSVRPPEVDTSLFKGLPEPPEGYHWELNPAYSDEFGGDKLDAEVWHDRSPYWVNGRPPATFRAATVSVKDGFLQIRNQPLRPVTEKYHIAGGAVASVAKSAKFGYFSARMKASKISMSSTFWMKNKVKDGCKQEQQELDIVEIVGKRIRGGDFNNVMHVNTHVFQFDCDGNKEVLSRGNTAPLVPAATDAFHTYACWWVDENTIHYYLDDKFQFTVNPKSPFDHPMYMHLVTETYNWEDPPSDEELLNDEINTTYYDWVRSFRLVKS